MNSDAEIVQPASAPAPAPSSRLFARVIPIFAGVAVIALLALLIYSVFGPRSRIGGRSGLVVNENGALVNVEPRPAGDFSLNTFDGNTLQLSNLRGQVVVVNFWASWCPPCRREAPNLQAAWRALQDEGVTFIGVDVWDKEGDARAFMNEFGITYPNGPDSNGSIAVDYGVTGIPETYVIDPNGRLAAKFIGPIETSQLLGTVRAIPR